jgi:hypothetical protein
MNISTVCNSREKLKKGDELESIHHKEGNVKGNVDHWTYMMKRFPFYMYENSKKEGVPHI